MNVLYILDFGSQYTQLIARKIRELEVYCEIVPYHELPNTLDSASAYILSGSPASCKAPNAPEIDLELILGKFPVLAICYGAQYIADRMGGDVTASDHREYGKARLLETVEDELWFGVEQNSQIWMSHGDSIKSLPPHANILGRTESIPIAAYSLSNFEAPVYALQFHPEVAHSLEGKQMLSNFVYRIAKLKKNWKADQFVETTVAQIKQQIGDAHVLMALSGGVDSTVAASLIHQAIGARLHCVFVDNGLLRKHEFEEVQSIYKQLGLNLLSIDAKQRFWDALADVTDPEEKRKIIGHLFIEIFDEEAKKLDNIEYLGQGTIYPDVIESVSVSGPSVKIKSHHNVGGLPEDLNLKLIEPMRQLFKDEVRNIGRVMGIPEDILGRHPFPGPGLAIRILGEVNEKSVRLLQDADYLYIQKLKEAELYDKIWQAGTILLPIQSVGVMGDERSYEQVVALRAVTSSDGMTAEWARIPYEVMADISTTIINKVKGINRVVYDISTKPPATIEWE